jgi:hypothetical protein
MARTASPRTMRVGILLTKREHKELCLLARAKDMTITSTIVWLVRSGYLQSVNSGEQAAFRRVRPAPVPS